MPNLRIGLGWYVIPAAGPKVTPCRDTDGQRAPAFGLNACILIGLRAEDDDCFILRMVRLPF